jgi:uncharacterized protein (TIGR02444 family)
MTMRPNPFWEYSVLLYGDSRVAAACLAIQERHRARADIDVNVLLLCTWAAATGAGELDNEKILRAVAAVGPWRRDVVLPLRSARQTLERGVEPVPKEMSESVRADTIKAELEAESIEQMMLVEIIGRPASRAVNSEAAIAQAATSFARYFTLLRVDPSPEDDRDLARILAVAFPGSRHGNEAGGG